MINRCFQVESPRTDAMHAARVPRPGAAFQLTLYDTDAASWARGRGWALALGVLLAGMDDPAEGRHRAMGDTALRNLIDGP